MVAAAAALVEKVARLSGKQWAEADDVRARAERLRLQAEVLVEEDSLAYLAYVEAIRSGEGVAGAQARTVDVPLEIVRAAADVSMLADRSAARGNPKLLADAVVAAMFASAAAAAAAYLVGVNVEEVSDPRLEEARRLAREASARLPSPAARGSAGGPGRGRARSAGSRRR